MELGEVRQTLQPVSCGRGAALRCRVGRSGRTQAPALSACLFCHGRRRPSVPLERSDAVTPVHASWLDQAELLIGGFGHHYLKRGSWANGEELIEQVLVSAPEYNRRYAHPLEWAWTNLKMRQWFA